MGRIGGLGVTGSWGPMDLFRYTASGQHDFTGGQDGQLTYFSVTGRHIFTGWQYHNSVNSFGRYDHSDLGDWNAVGLNAGAHDPFGPGGPGSGDSGKLSVVDVLAMEALGWSTSAGWRSKAVAWVAAGSAASGADVGLLQFNQPSGFSDTVAGISEQTPLSPAAAWGANMRTLRGTGMVSHALSDSQPVTNIALLGNYIASISPLSSASNIGPTVVVPDSSNQPTLLTQPLNA
jgi:hypothetical protein